MPAIRTLLILVADRNPRVRAFLRRELSQAGYRVRLAGTGRDVLGWAAGQEGVDLLIVDPDMPDMEGRELLDRIQGRFPDLPVIVHTCRDWASPHPAGPGGVGAFVEKNGSSVESLKRMIARMMREKALAERPLP